MIQHWVRKLTLINYKKDQMYILNYSELNFIAHFCAIVIRTSGADLETCAFTHTTDQTSSLVCFLHLNPFMRFTSTFLPRISHCPFHDLKAQKVVVWVE